MENLWKVTCYESMEEQWTEEGIRLSDQDMLTLLQMLLCRTLEHHEIIDAVTGRRGELLEIANENKVMTTKGSNLNWYTAQRTEPPR